MSNTVILTGFGPHVRFKTNTSGSVKVITKDTVKTVPLVRSTDINFVRAA